MLEALAAVPTLCFLGKNRQLPLGNPERIAPGKLSVVDSWFGMMSNSPGAEDQLIPGGSKDEIRYGFVQ